MGGRSSILDVDQAAEQALFRDAGGVLRRLHDALPECDLPGWAETKVERLERWVARAPEGLLEPGDVAFARSMIRELPELPAPCGVPCHGDWQPRNWLVTAEGSVLTFDFERTAINWWCHDILRMWWREWTDRADLAEAHLEGYGRRPDDDERAMITAVSAAEHITQIVWATEHGDTSFADAGRQNLAVMRRAS
ncbi:MAG: aminoglycoside phosphotransferase family protein [Acidimicrobiales bacterium]